MSIPPLRIRRRRQSDNRYRYVREVKGGAWQSRVWIDGPGRGFSLNLGLSTLANNEQDSVLAQRDAWVRSMAFVKAWVGDRTIGWVVQGLKDRDMVRADLVVPERAAGLRPLTHRGPRESAAEVRKRRAAERRLSEPAVAKVQIDPRPSTPATVFMRHVLAAKHEAARNEVAVIRAWLCEVAAVDRGELERLALRLLDTLPGSCDARRSPKLAGDSDDDPSARFLELVGAAWEEVLTVSSVVLRSWLTDDEGLPAGDDEALALRLLGAVEEVERERVAALVKKRPGRTR